MKVVLSGIYYPVAILRYFEAALRRRTDVELFTVGPYTAQWIPWNGGMQVKPTYAHAPDYVLPYGQQHAPISFVERKLPWKPDLWLQVDAGYWFTGKPSKGLNFIVATDPHCLSYDQQRTFADKFFCMQTPYAQPTDTWLPYAYDPIWHANEALHTQEYNAGLVGAPYDNRTKLVSALRKDGLSVLAPGYGPAYEEAREMYAKCMVGLNWSSLNDLCARVFEVAAMGLCPVVNRVPDLEKVGFVEDVHYLGFDSVEEGVEKVNFAVRTANWGNVAYNAMKFVKPHTWDARVEQVLEHAA